MAFVGDALAMPVHWYYNPMDIFRQFPGGITQFEAAPDYHPSSIMSLHPHVKEAEALVEEPTHSGRSSEMSYSGRKILGRNQLSPRHAGRGEYAECLLLSCPASRAAGDSGRYYRDNFLDAYIELMTHEPPQHPDTYAESYHRGFANLEQGRPAHKCGAVTHDTASIGGLVTIAPIVLLNAWQALHWNRSPSIAWIIWRSRILMHIWQKCAAITSDC